VLAAQGGGQTVTGKRKALEDAVNFLQEVLPGHDYGVTSAKVFSMAAQRGISERTLRRAIAKLRPRLFASQHGWHGQWRLHLRDEASATRLAEMKALLAKLENRVAELKT
jgi:hypothetical protein